MDSATKTQAKDDITNNVPFGTLYIQEDLGQRSFCQIIKIKTKLCKQ